MRSSLIGGLVDVLAGNINRKQPRVRVFEAARVFFKADGGFAQPEKVAGLAWGPRLPEQWGSKTERVDFFDVKADVEALLHPLKAEYRKAAHPAFHPGRCAGVLLDGKAIGVIGELHPQWVQAYDLVSAPVLFELDLTAVVARARIKAQPVSKLQPVRRDLALVADESLPVAELLAAFQRQGHEIVREVALFDVYRGKGVEEGKKSLAFSVLMQDNSRTLTDEDVEPVIQSLLAAAAELGAQLRI